MKMRELLAVLLSFTMILSVSAVAAEPDTAAALTTYEKFEDAAFIAEIPDSIMYVTMNSPEDAPLYALLARVGYTYDSFRQFMSTNNVVAYGLFLTDNETEFQVYAGHIGMTLDLTNADEATLGVYLSMAEISLEGQNATIVESGIYNGKNYNGFWFHYTVEANGTTQGVIQYSILHSDRAINIRAYNFNGLYPEDAEALIQQIYDSIIVN